MQVSLICVVLLVAASSVLSYDEGDLWVEERVAEKRAENRAAEQRSQRLQKIRELVHEIDALDAADKRDLLGGLLGSATGLLGNLPIVGQLPIVGGLVTNLANCVHLDAVTSAVNAVVTCLPIGGALGRVLPSSRSESRMLGLPIGDPLGAVNCLLNGIVGAVSGIVGTLLNTVTCTLQSGLVAAGPALNTVQTCLSGLLSGGLSPSGILSGLTACVNNLLGSLGALGIGGLPNPLSLLG